MTTVVLRAREVEIVRLRFDEQLWPRVRRDDTRVAHLADVLTAGGRLPAVKVQQGIDLVLGGWHTVAAYERLQRTTVPVEFVDIPDAERLLYAYREDVTSALPYSDADVRSVARRLYAQRSATNGDLPNVTTLARDLGRSQQTVSRWVEDLVATKQAAVERKRHARIIAVHAYRAAGLSNRRIAALLGIGETEVRRETRVSIAAHLNDSAIVTDAHSAIHMAIGQGATVAEMEAARDWLISQTDPNHLEQRARRSAWMTVALAVSECQERLQALPLPSRPDSWDGCESFRDDLRQALPLLHTWIAELKGRIE